MGTHVVTVDEVLDGHVALDRIYLNAYVIKLQTSAQVVAGAVCRVLRHPGHFCCVGTAI